MDMKKKVKAILLAAGYGTRLRPFTLKTPKCLVNINGVPLLEKWLKTLEDIGCDSVIINTHYLADKVEEYIKTREKTNLKIEVQYEENLLGTAGTLIKNFDFCRNAICFLIHVDNVTDMDLNKFLKFHIAKKNHSILSMLTFDTNEPENCGVVEIDKNGLMIDFHEKVDNPPTNIANGALYIFENDFLDFVENNLIKNDLIDFSLDVIPKLKGKVQTYMVDDHFIDIGTPERLALARKIFAK